MDDTVETVRLGGKGLHLKLLRDGGFPIPLTFYSSRESDCYDKLRDDVRYIVRSSARGEDSQLKTNAGVFKTMPNLAKAQVRDAVLTVTSDYDGGHGNAVIQPDLTGMMTYSGVAYSNMNGRTMLSFGHGDAVHSIVDGAQPETIVSLAGNKYSITGYLPNPSMLQSAVSSVRAAERYFGTPIEIEFAFLNGDANMTFLQARPLPNETKLALKEHEARRVEHVMSVSAWAGIKEIILGVGNDREILGDDQATRLSTSIFTSVFSGDGQSALGAFQLGRNEIGYDIGTEIYPSTLVVGGKVYFNFGGAALQFRPKGITIEDLVKVVNGVYIPMVRGNPSLLNYPELGLFVQFPEQAAAVGLDPKPYADLNERLLYYIKNIVMPSEIPRKRTAPEHETVEDACKAIDSSIKELREGSAKEYVKAARYAFFSLEYLRIQLERLSRSDAAAFGKLCEMFEVKKEITPLRDVLAYNQSIVSFEPPQEEDFRYQGSFELSLPRSFAQNRKTFKTGQEIPVDSIAEVVKIVRRTLEYREKMKFYLFRDYDYLKQLCDRLGVLTGKDIYNLDVAELSLLYTSPRLAEYRISISKRTTGISLFPDPIFEDDLRNPLAAKADKTKPRLSFGFLPDYLEVQLGVDAATVRSVDQTTSIPEISKVIFVQDNIVPGSHLFTLLSDYGIPVISLPPAQLKEMEQKPGAKFRVTLNDDNIDIASD